MSGNTFGNIFRIMSFGESHGVAVGVVIDGCPSNIPINLKDFNKDLKMRSSKPKHLWADAKRINAVFFRGLLTIKLSEHLLLFL